MRLLIYFFGLLTVTFGVMCTLGSVFLGSGILFLLGIALAAVGWMNSARRKTCPQCKKPVKYKALKCTNCGFDFSTLPQSISTKQHERSRSK